MTAGRALAVSGLGLALAASTLFCGGAEFEVASGDDGGTGSSSGGSSGGARDGGHRDAADPDGANGSPDAPVDLDTGADASAAFSCATPPVGTLFCADFDSVNAVGDTWGTPAITFPASSTAAFDPAHYLTSPHGFAATVGPNTGASAAELQNDTLISGRRTLEYSFSFYVTEEDRTAGATATIARLWILQANPRQLYVDLVIDDSGQLRVVQVAPASDGGTLTQNDLVPESFPLATWARVRLSVDRGSATPTLTLSIDEKQAIQVSLVTASASSNQIGVELGIIYAQPPTTGWSFSYDNVLVRAL